MAGPPNWFPPRIGLIDGAQLNAALNQMVVAAPNVPTLRNFVGVGSMVAFLAGTVTPNDGGQAFYYWDPTSVAFDNGTTVIRPGSVTKGAWLFLNIGAAFQQYVDEVLAALALIQQYAAGAEKADSLIDEISISSTAPIGFTAGGGGPGLGPGQYPLWLILNEDGSIEVRLGNDTVAWLVTQITAPIHDLFISSTARNGVYPITLDAATDDPAVSTTFLGVRGNNRVDVYPGSSLLMWTGQNLGVRLSPQVALPDDVVLTPAQTNGGLIYGESVSVGVGGQPAFYTTPSTKHWSFDVGPKCSKPGIISGANPGGTGPRIRLAEDNLTNDVGSVEGTLGAWVLGSLQTEMCIAMGVDPVVMHLGTGGKGGQTMAQLGVGSYWSQNAYYLMDQMAANAAAAGDTFAMIGQYLNEGANDQVALTPQATYQSELSAWIGAVNTYIGTPVHFYLMTSSYNIINSQGAAFATIAEAAVNDLAHLSLPDYILQRGKDSIHYLPIMHDLKGAYWGRSEAQVLADKEPDCVQVRASNPGWRRGNHIRIYYETPTALMFSIDELVPMTKDFGYAVALAASPTSYLTIASALPCADYVDIYLAADPGGGDINVGYAINNIAPGMRTNDGATGNLCDSTADMVTLSTTEIMDGTPTTFTTTYRMAHYAFPHLTTIPEID